jgi:polysaccharide biosynthesis transport protein
VNSSTEISPYLIERVGVADPGRGFLDDQFAPESSLGLRDYWLIVRKHLRMVVAMLMAAVTLTGVAVLLITPAYTSQALLLIERGTPQVLDIHQALPDSMTSDEYDYYKTQYELLKSRALAARVIREQRLAAELSAEIDNQRHYFQGPGAAAWSVGRWLGLLAAPSDAANPARIDWPRIEVDGVDARLIDAYLKHLEIVPRSGTRLVAVAYTAPDRNLAAAVANAHALAYIRQGLEMRANANEEAQRFLENKLIELRERVENSEAALNAYRRDKGILSLNGKENLALERLDELSRRVNEAEAGRIGLEAQEQMIRQRSFESLPAVIGSELIQKLKQEAAALDEEYAGMATQFKPGYEPLDQLHSQVKEAHARLDQEIQKVVDGIESAYLTAQAGEQELREEMEKQKAVVLAQNDAGVKYAILAREADTNRQLYDSVLQRMKEMGVAADIRASNIFVVDRAEAARFPSHPAKLTDLSISVLLGLAAAIGLALVLESLDNTLKSPDDVTRALGLPSLAIVPKFATINAALKPGLRAAAGGNNSRSELIVSRDRFSPATEAFRALRTNLLLSRAGEPPKVTLMTSALSVEGKTVTIVNTAALFASMGMKVVLVDADLRRPRCHELLLGKNGAGVTEVLTGQAELAEVIKPTPVDNLFLVSAGTIPPNPAELIGSKSMRATLDGLRQRFDFVFVDSAPVMIVSDSLFIAAVADGTVMLVDSSRTPRALVTEMYTRLHRVGAKVLGVVLNQVDTKHSGYYYHPDSYSYRSEPYRNGHAGDAGLCDAP